MAFVHHTLPSAYIRPAAQTRTPAAFAQAISSARRNALRRGRRSRARWNLTSPAGTSSASSPKDAASHPGSELVRIINPPKAKSGHTVPGREGILDSIIAAKAESVKKQVIETSHRNLYLFTRKFQGGFADPRRACPDLAEGASPPGRLSLLVILGLLWRTCTVRLCILSSHLPTSLV